MGFESAYKKLKPQEQGRVDDWCVACSKVNGRKNGRQVAKNLKNEKHLNTPEMIKLLKKLNSKTPITQISEQYDADCKDHHLQGRKSNTASIRRFYKVISEDDFSTIFREANKEKYTPSYKKLLRISLKKNKAIFLKKVGKIKSTGHPDRVTWATFFESDKKDFIKNKTTATEVFEILGLGHYIEEDVKKGGYCYIYEKSTLENKQVSLHVPTIADAGFYQYFRPVQKDNPPYGETLPIKRSKKLSMPEVVHKNQPCSILSDIEYLKD